MPRTFDPKADADQTYDPRYQTSLAEWIEGRCWDFTITLATNDPAMAVRPGNDVAFDKLHRPIKGWDARMNRMMIGHRWADPKRRCDRLLLLLCLEKPHVNPHWHGVARICGDDPACIGERKQNFEWFSEARWKEVVRSGTVKITNFNRDDLWKFYLSKDLKCMRQLNCIIWPDQFLVGGDLPRERVDLVANTLPSR